MPRLLRLLFLFVLAFSLNTAFAQRDLGTVTGTVTDAQGAAIPNAKVGITNDATGVVNNTATNQSGLYSQPTLNPGTYTVNVEAPGFQKSQQKGILVNPGAPTEVDLTLQVGSASQTVEVTAQAPLLETESPAVGENLNAAQVTEIGRAHV